MQVSVPTPTKFSKKFLAAIAVAILTYLGLKQGMTQQEILMVTGGLLIYIPSQGLADHGKEKAKVEAAAAATPPSTQ